MGLSGPCLIPWQQNALWIWLTFAWLASFQWAVCFYVTWPPGGCRATSSERIPTSQKKKREGDVKERPTLTDLNHRFLPWYRSTTTAANVAQSPWWLPSHLSTGLTAFASTHRENIRAAVRGKMITRDQGICCWQAGAECVFRWWQAPGGLTDRPADFMLKHYLSGSTQACKLLTAVHIQ